MRKGYLLLHPLRENVHNSLAVGIHVAKRQIKKSKNNFEKNLEMQNIFVCLHPVSKETNCSKIKRSF